MSVLTHFPCRECGQGDMIPHDGTKEANAKKFKGVLVFLLAFVAFVTFPILISWLPAGGLFVLGCIMWGSPKPYWRCSACWRKIDAS